MFWRFRRKQWGWEASFQKEVSSRLTSGGVVADVVRRIPEWDEIGWLSAGFSRRLGGVTQGFAEVREKGWLNLGFVPQDDPEAVEENRRRLLEAIPGESWRLVVARQVHGVEVREVTQGTVDEAMDGGRGRWEADGLVTAEAGLLLGAGAADCVPVLVADLRLRAVGAFHAGWRGTAARMAQVGLARMTEAFGTRAEDCVAAIGPSIGACCYEVGEEVRAAFSRQSGVLVASGEQWRLDLWEANRQQLIAAGVPEAKVIVFGECTACSRDEEGRRLYFSHRAEMGQTGRMLGVIGVRHVER